MEPLLRVICDQYASIQPGPAGMVVSTPADFTEARRTIEAIKRGELPGHRPWMVVVQRSVYLSGFEDLRCWGSDLISFEEVSPRAVVETALVRPLSEEITNEILLAWGIRSDADLPPGLAAERDLESLLDQALENVSDSSIWSRAAMSGEHWLADWLGYLLVGGQDRLHADSYLVRIVRDRISNWRKEHPHADIRTLTELLYDAMVEGHGTELARQVVARSLLRPYGPAQVKLVVTNIPGVGPWRQLQLLAEEWRALGELIDRLYNDGILSGLVDEVDPQVRNSMDVLHPPARFDQYVQGMTGRLPSEFESAIALYCKDLLESLDSRTFGRQSLLLSHRMLSERFAPLLAASASRFETHLSYLQSLLRLATLVDSLRAVKPTDLQDWRATCDSLMQCEGLLRDLVRGLLPAILSTVCRIEETFAATNRRLNDDYATWLLAHFPEFLQNPASPRLVTRASWLANEAPSQAVLLLVDNLRWDWWKLLEARLLERGYQVDADGARGLSMIPTVTNVSRRAALGSFPLAGLADFVDDVYGIDVDPDEEARLAARVLGFADEIGGIRRHENRRIQFLPSKYVYVNGDLDDIRQALSLPANRYVIVYTAIDRAAHNIMEDEVLQGSIKETLARLADAIVTSLEHNRKIDRRRLRLIVTSDHGSLNTRWSERQRISDALSDLLGSEAEKERHGRLVQLVVAQESHEFETVRERLAVDCRPEIEAEWHVIWGEDASRYGLPALDRKGNHVVAWLAPRGLDYVARGGGPFVHGGFSLFETLVPLASLSYRHERIVLPPDFTVSGTQELRKDAPSVITIKVGNTNQHDVDCSISIPLLRVESEELPTVPSGSTTSADIPVMPTVSGRVTLQFVLRYRAGGSEHMQLTRELPVEIAPSRADQLRASTTRELF